MAWSHFVYLAPLALVAIAALAGCMKCAPSLMQKECSAKKELGILAGILVLGCLALYGSFFLENSYYAYSDAGSDTMDLYVPFYLNLVESVQSGTLDVWNFTYGLGVGTQNLQSWLFDPFNLVLVPVTLLVGTAHLSAVLALVQSLRIVVCGLLFDRLLTRYCHTPLARIVGGCLFPLCTFLIMWGQHYWIGTSLVFLTALLWAMDALLDQWTAPRFAGVAAVSFLTVGWSPYGGFMVLLGAAFYGVFRVIYLAHDVRGGLRLVARLIVPVMCGCLISGVVLVPYATYLFTETSRTTSDYTFAQKLVLFASSWAPLQWIPMIFSRFIGGSLVVTGVDIPGTVLPQTELLPSSNYYEILSLGFSVGAIVLVLQFFHWVFTETDRKTKVLVSVAAVLVILFCFNNLLPALFNLFVVVGECRSSFVIAVPICIALAIGWENRVQNGTLNMPLLVIGAVVTFAVLAWSLTHVVSSRLPVVAYAACAVAMVVLCVVICKRLAPQLLMVLLAVLFASSLVDGFFMVNNRATATEDTFPEAAQPTNKASDTMEALQTLYDQDGSFYRVEKTYVDWDFANDSLVEGYAGVSSYNSVEDGDLITFYKAVWPDICGWAYWLYYLDPDAPELTTMLGVKYVLSRTPVALQGYELFEQVGDIYIYKNDEACLLTGKTSTISESAFNAAGTVAEKRSLIAQSVVVPDDQVENAANAASSSDTNALTVSDVELTSGQSELTAKVSASDTVTACLSLPYTEGWSVTVDGQPVETFRADIGFVGFTLEPGEHTVVACYGVPGMKTGAVLSVIGLAFAVIAVAIGRRGKRGVHAKKD